MDEDESASSEPRLRNQDYNTFTEEEDVDLNPVDNLNTNGLLELLLTLEEKINNLKYKGRLEQAVKEEENSILPPASEAIGLPPYAPSQRLTRVTYAKK